MSLERKIRALRAKAASTTFPAERDSCNAKADQLEAKLRAEQPQPQPNPYSYTWTWPNAAYEEALAKAARKTQRRQRQPWQGSMGEHDAIYREVLERMLKEAESKWPDKSPRVRDILARRMANAEMIDRFGVD